MFGGLPRGFSSMPYCNFECCRRSLRDQSRLKRHEFLRSDGLSNFTAVSFNQAAKRRFHQPDSDKAVPLLHHNHGVKADGFGGCGKQQCGVEACRQPVAQNRRRQTRFLPHLLEAAWRIRIRQRPRSDRRPQCRHQKPGSLRITALVAIKRGRVPMLFQQSAGVLDDIRNGRIVRRHKGGQQLATGMHPTPFISRQHSDFMLDLRDHLVVPEQTELYNASLGFIEPVEIIRIEADIAVTQLQTGFGRQPVDDPVLRTQARGTGS